MTQCAELTALRKVERNAEIAWQRAKPRAPEDDPFLKAFNDAFDAIEEHKSTCATCREGRT